VINWLWRFRTPEDWIKMKVRITDLSIDHTSAFTDWIADKQAIKYTLSKFLPDRDEEWVMLYIKSLIEDTSTWDQAIVLDDDIVVGYCGLSNISKQNRSAEYFIIIGNKKYWNAGIGTYAGSLVLDYGFSKMKLHRIWLTVSDLNHGAIKSYEKLGFTEEGHMKEACLRNGKFHDKVVMSILENQWHTSQCRRPPEPGGFEK